MIGQGRAPDPRQAPAPSPHPPLSGTIERYLETIYYINHEDEVARPGRLAEWLGVSAPTVSVSLQRLARDGWVSISSDRSVRLTTAGGEAAAAIVRRHRLVERWLTDVLGLDWATADSEAGGIAHGISGRVLERLDAHLGHPSTCPHGNHIPGHPMLERRLVCLAQVGAGNAATVIRISEVAEHDAPELLAFLDAQGLVPGASIVVTAVSGAQVSLVVGGRERVTVDGGVGEVVWVERSSSPQGPGSAGAGAAEA